MARLSVVAGLVALALLLFVATCSGYDSRRIVNEALGESVPMRLAVEDFHRRHGRLPAAGDAGLRPELRLRRAGSVEWNAGEGMVVIAVEPRSGTRGRIGLAARAAPGGIEWACRSIDLDPKYLPASCR